MGKAKPIQGNLSNPDRPIFLSPKKFILKCHRQSCHRNFCDKIVCDISIWIFLVTVNLPGFNPEIQKAGFFFIRKSESTGS